MSDTSTSTSLPCPLNSTIISGEAVLRHEDHNDNNIHVIFESNFFASPYPNSIPFQSFPTPLPTNGSVISFMALRQYMDYCLNEGARINCLSWSVFKKLPYVKMTEDVFASYNGVRCPICRENFKIGEIGEELPCRHLYHKDCISFWFEKKATCPVCQFELTSDIRYSSVTSGEIGGSGEHILMEKPSDKMPRIFEIDMHWPVNSSERINNVFIT